MTDKEYDMNLSEENNLSNDELQDLSSVTDYSASIIDSSALASPHNIFQGNNNSYLNSMFQANNKNGLMNNYQQQGSSSDWDWMRQKNANKQNEFAQYIVELTHYICKFNPEAVDLVLSNINKYKNGDLDLEYGRNTPLLFPDMHSLAKLDFPGVIYKLIPSTLSQNGGVIEISDEIYPKFDFHTDDYPGPLTIEKTTEEQIFYYLNEQMINDLDETSTIEWDSGHLLVKYLELLIKENGKPRVSNVVKLLNEGIDTRTADLKRDYKQFDSISRNSFSRASSRATSRASSRAPSPERLESIDHDLPQNVLDFPRGPGSVASVMRKAVQSASQEQKNFQNMDKFREYIWSGRFEEAINFAIRVGTWDHAFALALRMNNQTLVNEILVRFSRRAICGNDPLFTMHELMAGRPPRIVASNRGFSHSEMGDWRSHLSMIEAVRKFKPEESRQAIESMGEKLLLLGNYFGAHLCFLMAGTSFGIDRTAHKYRRKVDLLGWFSSTSNIPAQKSSYEHCHKLFSGMRYWQSAPEQCIRLTEVYEYILRLKADGSHRVLALHLLPYKYLMVLRMLERGRTRTAYEYCRAIGDTFGYEGVTWLKFESVNFKIVNGMRILGHKLHSLLTANEDSIENVDKDIQWLKNIDNVYGQFCRRYKLWDPSATTPDFLLTQMMAQKTREDADESLLSDSCSMVGPEYEYDDYNPMNAQDNYGHYHTSSRAHMPKPGATPTNIYAQTPQPRFSDQPQRPGMDRQTNIQHPLPMYPSFDDNTVQSKSNRIPVTTTRITQPNLPTQTQYSRQSDVSNQMLRSAEASHQAMYRFNQSQHRQNDSDNLQSQSNLVNTQNHMSDQARRPIGSRDSTVNGYKQNSSPLMSHKRYGNNTPVSQTFDHGMDRMGHQPPSQLNNQYEPNINMYQTSNGERQQQQSQNQYDSINLMSQTLDRGTVKGNQPPLSQLKNQYEPNNNMYQTSNRETQQQQSQNQYDSINFMSQTIGKQPPQSKLQNQYDHNNLDMDKGRHKHAPQLANQRDQNIISQEYNGVIRPPQTQDGWKQLQPSLDRSSMGQMSSPPPPSGLPNEMMMMPPPSHRPDIKNTLRSSLDRDDISSQYQPRPTNDVPHQPPLFVPGNNQRRESGDTVDCFNTTRSRSQSTDSVDNTKPVSQSPDSNESKETKSLPPISKPLQSTKEEMIITKPSTDTKSESEVQSNEKKRSWNPLSLFGSSKTAHLPDDTEPTLQFDPVKNRWVDKSNPEDDRPPTPPPLMPLAVSRDSHVLSQPAPSLFQGNSQPSGLSKYRQAGVNVKKSVQVSSPTLPSFILPPTIMGVQPPKNQDYADRQKDSSHLNGYSSPHQSHSGQDYNGWVG